MADPIYEQLAEDADGDEETADEGSRRTTNRREARQRWDSTLDDLDGSDDLPVDVPEPPPEIRAEPETEDGGKLMAVLSHLSVFFGVPVFLIPLFRREEPLATDHARAAAVVYTAFYATLAVALFGAPLVFALTMFLYVPAAIGVYQSVLGAAPGPWAGGRIATWLFGQGLPETE